MYVSPFRVFLSFSRKYMFLFVFMLVLRILSSYIVLAFLLVLHALFISLYLGLGALLIVKIPCSVSSVCVPTLFTHLILFFSVFSAQRLIIKVVSFRWLNAALDA